MMGIRLINIGAFARLMLAGGVAACIALLAQAAVAGSTSDYRQRVDATRRYVEEVSDRFDDGDTAFERDAIRKIITNVPATERIEWSSGGIDTDNRWLATDLDALSKERNTLKGQAILSGIGERLLALSESIGELEKAVAASRTKDEDKQKLAEILKREEYQKPEVKEESLFQRWLRQFFDWLDRVFPRPQILPAASSGLGSFQTGLQILVYALVIGLVGFLIYRFAPFFAGRFGSRPKKEKRERVILGERIGSDESAADLFSEAEALAREGNLRGAIRKGYIALLCELSDRRVIGLARHKTNRDYLRDVSKNQPLFENMTGLTGSFERNWYGLGQAEMRDWEDFRDRYRRTIGEVSG